MSQWTSVNGIVQLSTPSSNSLETMFIARTVIEHLPKITGSESDITYHLQLVDRHNCSTEDDSSQNDIVWQSDVLLILNGQLRDRLFKQTLKETTHMLTILAERLSIVECLVCITGQRQKHIIHNPDWLLDMKLDTDWLKQILHKM